MTVLGCCGGSAPGQGVLQSALRIELVPAARQFERAEIFVVVLAVVADGLYDPIGPLIVDAKELAVVILQAEEAAYLGIGCRRFDLVDIRLGYGWGLGLQHGVVHPLHKNGPALVALAAVGAEKFPRDQFGQDDPILRVLHRRARRRNAAAIIGIAVAAPGLGGGK